MIYPITMLPLLVRAMLKIYFWRIICFQVHVSDRGLVSMVTSIDLDPGHSIKRPLFLSNSGNSIYVLTESKVSLF